MPLIIDAHEDLAYNMLTFGRDYTRPAAETRHLEAGTDIPVQSEGDCVLGWPDYQRGQVALVFSTLFAAPRRRKVGDWDTQSYADANEAHRVYRQQLDLYARLEDAHPDLFRLVGSQGDLAGVLADWERPLPVIDDPDDHRLVGHPVGLLVSMEGAEGVRSPEELEEWWDLGVRAIGPAWAGTRFCGGTREPGPLTKDGRALLEAMADIGFILDITHMDEAAVLQALDSYPGVIIASHSNVAALNNNRGGNRHLSDRVIRGLLERDGRIGIVPYNKFLNPTWIESDGKMKVTLQEVVAHMDYICQMAGDARHVGLGTDFDGGIGYQTVPAEINTIADLQKVGLLLAEHGYSPESVAAILGQNWLDILRRALPEK
jgi:membrane dipeptidase